MTVTLGPTRARLAMMVAAGEAVQRAEPIENTSSVGDHAWDGTIADLRKAAQRKLGHPPTTDEMREVGRAIVRAAVPRWEPGKKLTANEYERIGRKLDETAGVQVKHSLYVRTGKRKGVS